MNIKQVQRILMTNFFFMVIVALLLVALYETEILEPTDMASDATLMFGILTMMELITIIVIPLALKMFSLKAVHRKLVLRKGDALLPWVRLASTCSACLCSSIPLCIIRPCRQLLAIWLSSSCSVSSLCILPSEDVRRKRAKKIIYETLGCYRQL